MSSVFLSIVGFALGQAYGQTEFTILGCQSPSDDKKESLGKPNGMYTVKVRSFMQYSTYNKIEC